MSSTRWAILRIYFHFFHISSSSLEQPRPLAIHQLTIHQESSGIISQILVLYTLQCFRHQGQILETSKEKAPDDMKKAEVMSSTPGTPSSVSPTVSHFQAPTPGPTTAQMIEGRCLLMNNILGT